MSEMSKNESKTRAKYKTCPQQQYDTMACRSGPGAGSAGIVHGLVSWTRTASPRNRARAFSNLVYACGCRIVAAIQEPAMLPPALAAMPRRLVLVLTLAAVQSGCAPGAWNDQSSFDAYLDVIEDACPQRIGQATISTLENNDASFLDTTSRLYYGKIDAAAYRQFITAFHGSSAQTNQAVDCIVAHLPDTPPPAPGLIPSTGIGPSAAPPPPAPAGY
jgi:hypothetical protein